MAEEQSSLRTAIDKIMGWPGGAPQEASTGGTPTSGFTQPRSGVVNLGTTSGISNVIPEAVPDPFEAQLSEIRAQNNALSASLAAPAAVAAAPAAAAAAPAAASAPYVPSYTMPLQDYMNYIYDFNSMENKAAGGKGFSGKGPGTYSIGNPMVDPNTGQSQYYGKDKGATYRPADYNRNIAWVPPTGTSYTLGSLKY